VTPDPSRKPSPIPSESSKAETISVKSDPAADDPEPDRPTANGTLKEEKPAVPQTTAAPKIEEPEKLPAAPVASSPKPGVEESSSDEGIGCSSVSEKCASTEKLDSDVKSDKTDDAVPPKPGSMDSGHGPEADNRSLSASGDADLDNVSTVSNDNLDEDADRIGDLPTIAAASPGHVSTEPAKLPVACTSSVASSFTPSATSSVATTRASADEKPAAAEPGKEDRSTVGQVVSSAQSTGTSFHSLSKLPSDVERARPGAQSAFSRSMSEPAVSAIAGQPPAMSLDEKQALGVLDEVLSSPLAELEDRSLRGSMAESGLSPVPEQGVGRDMERPPSGGARLSQSSEDGGKCDGPGAVRLTNGAVIRRQQNGSEVHAAACCNDDNNPCW